MKKIVSIVLTIAFMAIGGTAMAAISGSPHDYSTVGNYGECNICHVPHAAAMAQRLWVVDKSAAWGGPDVTWTDSKIGQLCGRCHNTALGLIVSNNNDGNGPHKVEDSAYAAASHGRTMATLGGATNATIRDTAADAATRPYLTNTRMECTSCHDPHQNAAPLGVTPFLRAVGGDTTVSDVCDGCHDRGFVSYGTANTTARTIGNAASMHPAGVTYADQAGNENNAATVLKDLGAVGVSPLNGTIDAADWQLGGKMAVPGSIGCETCHAVHGTNNAAGAANAAPNNIYLLAINNNGAFTSAPLCEACHGGGVGGAASSLSAANSDGAGGTSTDSWYVGRGKAVVGAFDDHPIDATIDGVPAVINWANAANARYERYVGAGDPFAAAASDNWPVGDTAGSYVEGGVQMGKILCTSCHSAHNGISNTSLRRKGGTIAGTTDPTAAGMAGAPGDVVRTDWCYNCHQLSDMVPAFHHSTNDTSPAPANYDAGEILGGNSGIQCDDCHLMAGVLNAHNGFFNLTVANPGSELCLTCHAAADPATGFSAPNGHLRKATNGTGSHYIGTFADGSTSSNTWDINVKRGYWRTVDYKGNPAAAVYSKYGGDTDTHHLSAPTVHDGTQTVVCESCHSVLFNAGWDGVGAWDGFGASEWLAEGGWRTNLLLQLYEDREAGVSTAANIPAGYNVGEGTSDVDGIDTGSGFCIQCHNQGNAASIAINAGTANGLVLGSLTWGGAINQNHVPKNMHPMTGWTITRAVDSGRAVTSLITGAGTYADSATAPTTGGAELNYPTADAMDCDSCHKVHFAGSAPVPGQPKTLTGAANTVPAILEETAAGVTQADDVCVSCHNR